MPSLLPLPQHTVLGSGFLFALWLNHYSFLHAFVLVRVLICLLYIQSCRICKLS